MSGRPKETYRFAMQFVAVVLPSLFGSLLPYWSLVYIKSSFPMECNIIFVGSYPTNCFLGFKYVQYLPRNMKYPQTKACFCTGSSHFLWCPLFGVLNLRWIIPIDILVCVGLVPISVPWHFGFNMQLWCRLYTIEYIGEGRPWHVIMIQAIYYRNL